MKKALTLIGSLLLCCQISFSQGDDCATAFNLNNLQNYCTNTAVFTNQDATASPQNLPSCWAANNSSDVWFSFIATATDLMFNVYGANALPSANNTLIKPCLALYSGICGQLSEMRCVPSNGTNLSTLFKNGLQIGTTYYLRVSTLATNKGTFDICINNYSPSFQPEADCTGAAYLCDKSPVSVTDLQGSGNVQEGLIPGTCFDISGESNSSWFKWTCSVTGPLTMDILGADPLDDIDWIVFEMPNGINSCAGILPQRCNVANCLAPDGTMSTGMNSTDTDVTEPAGCEIPTLYNSYTSALNMEAGKSYVMMVNNFSTTSAFTIKWSGSGQFQGPKADFTKDSILTCTEKSFTFDGHLSESYETLTWNFSNGSNPTSADGAGPHTVNYNLPGTYSATLTATDDKNCHTSKSTIIKILSVDGLQGGTISLTQPTCKEQGQILVTNITGGTQPYSYAFNTNSFSPSNLMTGPVSGTYEIHVKDINGCQLDTSITILINELAKSIFIPNCFTPNNDGENNHWYVKGDCIENFNCTIVNRWGQTVKSLQKIEDMWDGTINGAAAEDGIYYYNLNYNYYGEKAKIESGFITILTK